MAVGYMDPGNWATDIAGGAQFGYAPAERGTDLATCWRCCLQHLARQAGHRHRPRPGPGLPRPLFQPVGHACCGCSAKSPLPPATWPKSSARPSPCNLLFGLPLTWGVILTAFDVLLMSVPPEPRLPADGGTGGRR
ncbi:MAG: hypothetical protein WKG07_44075 [Hymenobacter sp.]